MDMNSVAALFVATVIIFVFLLCLVATIHVSFIWGSSRVDSVNTSLSQLHVLSSITYHLASPPAFTSSC
ncbi:unnamed protein product, partial [Brassica oleracea]